MVRLLYKGNWFSNDEIQITNSAAALLENVSVVTEDRIGTIVAQISSAPVTNAQKNLIDLKIPAKMPVKKTITEIVEISNVFILTPTDLAKEKITKPWKIQLPGLQTGNAGEVDAEFTLTNAIRLPEKALAMQPYKGLFSRPLVIQEWTFKKGETGAVSFYCLVPDTRSLLKIRVRRSYFIKKQQLPKFHQGLLIENTITKPSELEGLISIPINIGKAILSIPAQLLQFKIAHINQETAYQKKLTEFIKSRDAAGSKTNDDALKKIGDQLEAIKKKQNEGIVTIPPADVVGEEPVPELGKLPAKPAPGIFAEEKKELLDIMELKEDVVSGIDEPKDHDWSEGIKDWDEYDNIKTKTCVPAAAAHLVKSWTFNSKQPDRNITLPDVMAVLIELAPSHDITNGCYMSDFMSYWKKTGLKKDIIDRFVSFKKQEITLLKKAVYYFGGCMIGLQLPISAKGKSRWDFPSTEPEKDNENWGGHTVCVLGYKGDDFTVISWGKVIQMSAQFYQQFNDEAYAALSRTDWTTPNDQSPTGEGLGFKSLSSLLNKLYNA